ncbi:DUF6708 domain-containing protein [Psychrobacter fozii]|uniref:DUF6708 domain-containing protein n=1 Tax=Psychrobacter fozii TaxID=198480 RepID=UPI001917D8BE|nr:DUF6708 domain-containing protein [Psychrobacter fozii]
MIDMIGRGKNGTYDTLGKAYKVDHLQHELYPYQKLDYPLRPQRTVVQFNSTYMELVDMWDSIRGEMVWSQLFLSLVATVGLGVVSYIMLSEFNKSGLGFSTLFYIVADLIWFGFIYVLLRRLSRELFTYTYFPIRFNRKEGKVYVIGANKKVETYDWGSLKIQMQTDANAPWDIRCSDVDDKGIIQRTFSLPFRYDRVYKVLYGHFEFVNRYMSAKDDSELAEVASSIRHIFPVHQRKETFKESVQRSLFEYHQDFYDMEYPEDTLKLDWTFMINIPFWFLKLLGRRLAVLTSTTPHFPFEIEVQCDVDPNDKFDLNKNPPIPALMKHATLLEKVFYVVMMVVATLASLSILAIIIDIIGAARPHGDYPSFFKILWDLLLLRWI